MSGSPWRKMPAREIEVGQRVSVRGITDRNTAIVDVREVERTHVDRGELVVVGRQPWGMGSRHIVRHLDPDQLVELYVAPEVES
jgi:hypothetical protein